MGLFTRDLPNWARQVRTSAHACTRCGAMIALDLLDEHNSWHRTHDAPGRTETPGTLPG